MKEDLKNIFENVNNWMKFAEAKNGTLIVADLAIIFGVFQLLEEMCCPKKWLIFYASIVMLLSLLSATICLTSFVPQLRMPWFINRGSPSKNDNLLYFAHIAKYAPKIYLNKLSELLKIQLPEKQPKLEMDYAEQIVTNSRITLRKYQTFKIGVWLTIIAIAGPIALILYLIDKFFKDERDDD